MLALSAHHPKDTHHHMSQPAHDYQSSASCEGLGIDHLIDLVDEHIAWQLEAPDRVLSRRSSEGTLIVDWDGVGEMRVHRRTRNYPSPFDNEVDDWEHHDSVASHSHLAGTRDDEGWTHTYHHAPATHSHSHSRSSRSGSGQRPRSPHVTGHDPATNFTYDYNGRIIHVHRDQLAHPSRPESLVSEYFAVDADAYRPGVPVRVVDADKALSALPGTKEKVVRFVEKALGKLEAWGVLRRLRGDMRRGSRRRRRKEGWV